MLQKDNYYGLDDLAGKSEDKTKEEIKKALFEHGPLQIGGAILGDNWQLYQGGYKNVFNKFLLFEINCGRLFMDFIVFFCDFLFFLWLFKFLALGLRG